MTLPADPPTTAAQPRWGREDSIRTAGLLAVITALHLLAFGVLVLLVVPNHYTVGSQVFGVGLGVTAYTLGMRHAFDADHIAAIDNTTRKLMADGRRPVFGDVAKFQEDPDWHDLVPFHEYFHGDTGAGLGASHQTGWTALVANLILRTRR